MPIQEADPWRLQYFENAACPPDVNIPTDDEHAWTWYPRHRWIYDKVAVALSQNLDAGPHGIIPPRFPVFSKPMINLRGMGAGSRVIELDGGLRAPSHGGAHVDDAAGRPARQLDVAVIAGEPQWWRHVTGRPGPEGTFDYWTIHAEHDAEIEVHCGAWIRRHLSDYSGMLNFETIGGRSSRCICGSVRPMAGPLWSRAGSRPSCGLYRPGLWGYCGSPIVATGTAWCCAGPRGGTIAIRRLRPVEEMRAVSFPGSQRADHLP